MFLTTLRRICHVSFPKLLKVELVLFLTVFIVLLILLLVRKCLKQYSSEQGKQREISNDHTDYTVGLWDPLATSKACVHCPHIVIHDDIPVLAHDKDVYSHMSRKNIIEVGPWILIVLNLSRCHEVLHILRFYVPSILVKYGTERKKFHPHERPNVHEHEEEATEADDCIQAISSAF